ncbi:MAG: UDP-3-O-(3-hydroxymyristoyl)glucosamine N-acyltransferase [Bacteroidales bacterium]|nr:UDP-3-O-(3-hydroxymyristoyl)glucosamine N-acyltransferase [Bacteroidales bacterium]
MEFSAQQIAEFLQGEVVGDVNVTVNNVTKIEEGVPGTLCFLANPKYEHHIYNTKASVVLVNNDFIPESAIGSTLIKVENAYTAFASLLEMVNQYKHSRVGISERASIAPSATIGENVYIGDFVVIEDRVIVGNNTKIYPQSWIGQDAKIGNDSVINSGVKIYHECNIGAFCTLHANVVIGSDGFGFAPQQDNEYKKVPQIGNVIIEDHVEIGANATIDRATMGSTIIRKGVKLDNLVQIAHNVEIGKNTVIAAQTGVSGSTKVGANCMIGGQVGLAGHINIPDEVKIGAQSGLASSLTKEGAVVLGSPAFDISKYRRTYAYFRNLPKLADQISQLQKEVENLKK